MHKAGVWSLRDEGWIVVLALATAQACGASERSNGASESGAAGASNDGSGVSGSAGEASTGVVAAGGAAADEGGGAGSAGRSTGGSVDADPFYRGGTRLKPIVFRSEDVQLRFSDMWWDSELQTMCYYRFADACEPAWEMGYAYQDADCTMPLLEQDEAECWESAFPEWIPRASTDGRQRSNTNPRPDVLRRVGDRVTPSVVYSLQSDGSCLEGSPIDGIGYYPAERVPYDMLVGSQRVARERAPGMDAYMREADDGAFEVERFYDPERDVSCLPSPSDADPAYRCVPQPVDDFSTDFADPECTQRTMVPSLGGYVTEETQSLLVWGGRSGCEAAPYELFQRGETVQSPPYSLMDTPEGTECTRVSVEPLLHALAGDSIDPFSLPEIERMRTGEGRLEVPLLGFAGVSFMRDSDTTRFRGAFRLGFFERASGTTCLPTFFSDGSAWCVPPSYRRTGGPYYANDSCDSEFVYALYADCSGSVEGVIIAAPGCSSFNMYVEAHAVAPFTGDNMYSRSDGTCQQVELPDAELYVSAGRLEPADVFAPLEFVKGE